MSGGIVRPARRPAGWVAPGPPPAVPPPAVGPYAGEDLCWLAGDWRIFQRVDGHRWSLDDLVTAWLAARAVPAPARIADLGCGIGSVLLLLAWRFPAARAVGVEAQALSVDLARRSVAWNGAADRVVVCRGDLRDPVLLADLGGFDLVTGTPPYLAPGAGTESQRVQRGPCRFTHRGAIEDYCRAAARVLAPDGRFVACEAAGRSSRVARAADDAGLAVRHRLDVVPRAGKAPLFSVYEMRRAPGDTRPATRLTVRDVAGRWTAAFRAVRRDMGVPAAPP